MKRLLATAVLAVVLGGSSGCCLIDRLFHCRPPGGPWGPGTPCCSTFGPGCGGCNACCGAPGDFHGPMGAPTPAMGPMYSGYGSRPTGGIAKHGRGRNGDNALAASGPPTGAVAYPYYTNRGPRDFLARNPGNIGP